MSQRRNFDLNKYLQSSKQKSYFVTAVTLSLVVLVFLVGILPAYSAIVFQIDQNKKRDEATKTLQAVIEQFKNFINQEENEFTILSTFNDIFPEKMDQSSVIEDFVNFTKQRDIELKSISFSQVQREIPLQREFKTRDVVKYQYASINVAGSRRNILDLIEDVERSKRIYNIVNLEISKDYRGLPNTSEFNATIRVEFYWTQKGF
ncbi:MAG: hypothetical protein KatS3mg085_185 [Candidatus Dojkabacteria bacterium]|nr:MAG: hypothetical protein KatS3mg085_185 [Candidatus Dojkabacteria bacterium]